MLIANLSRQNLSEIQRAYKYAQEIVRNRSRLEDRQRKEHFGRFMFTAGNSQSTQAVLGFSISSTDRAKLTRIEDFRAACAHLRDVVQNKPGKNEL